MKKTLLFFWNRFVIIIRKAADLLFLAKDKIYTLFKKAPTIMTSEETVNYILKNNCSIARFGDGEIKLLIGKDIFFQKSTERISQQLKEALNCNDENILVCLPAVFSDEQCSVLNEESCDYWKMHLSYYRKYWYKELNDGEIYGNAFISRHYMNLKDKKTGCAEYFELVKKIWEDKDIIIVEGEKSRLGMGNDLFDGAKSVRRILGPSTQCFLKYDELLEEAESHGRDALYILALGPTASVMAYDMAKKGFHAIDMGNIDTEYEWFLAGATNKQPVKNKLVYEAMRGTVGEADDPKYLSQIIAKIL